MDQDKKRPLTFKVIAFRVTALVLALWLVFMICLTWAVAKDFYNQVQNTARDMAIYDYHVRYGSNYSEELPGYQDMLRVMSLGDAYSCIHTEQLLPFVHPQRPDSYGTDDWFYGEWDLLYGFQPAVIMYDVDGNILLKSGNILSFSYCSEVSWIAQAPKVEGLTHIDLDAMSYGQNEITWALWGRAGGYVPSTFSSPCLRLTGYFVGDEFVPVTIDRADNLGLINEYTHEQLAVRDGRGYLDWENVYTVDAPDGMALTTIYSWETGGFEYEYDGVMVKGVFYNSLVDYLETAMEEESWYSWRQENLIDSIIIFAGKPAYDPEVGRLALAIRCWPMQYAAVRLIPTYLVSFAVVALALWLILRSIRRNVTEPMETMIRNLVRDYPIEPSADWKEPYALETLLQGEQRQRRALVNDNQQLQKSLEYARNAEENRRQLISNITHELKTPLAIIHSYAEGLQSGIAEEKKEKYLSTILEESERMDAMVFEMLDFSRLESGKVRLSTDHFSLLELTEGIAEKLTPAAGERGLSFSWGFTNECRLTADESRLGQVVTNLVSNAVRYAKEDGTIWIRVFSDENNAYFQIENQADHLPKETLEKLFETFYRADDSRTGKGTGLGLPIAKSIVDLHRGTLTAANTWVNGSKCIQFSFQIPLK